MKASILVLAACTAAPATAAFVGFASSNQDYNITALNNGNGYSAITAGSTSLAIGTVLTSDAIDAAETTSNANASIRFNQSYVANEDGGYFGFERAINLNLGPFVDQEFDYDGLTAQVFGNPYDTEFEATDFGILRLTWSFVNGGGGTGLSVYLDTPSMNYSFSNGAGTLDIFINTGDTITVRGENMFSASAPYYGSTIGFFDFKFRQIDDNPGVVPEPASWAMMIAGFGLVGSAMRRRRATGNGVTPRSCKALALNAQ